MPSSPIRTNWNMLGIPSSGWLRRVPILVPAGIAAALGIWYFATGSRYVPRGVLRIGFENVPSVQIRTANGPAGMAVETLSEAAKRASVFSPVGRFKT